jgi:hypothetical protein
LRTDEEGKVYFVESQNRVGGVLKDNLIYIRRLWFKVIFPFLYQNGYVSFFRCKSGSLLPVYHLAIHPFLFFEIFSYPYG